MSTQDIIRAWKDEDFRIGMSTEQSSLIPESPIGYVELSDDELAHAAGAESYTHYHWTCPCTLIMCNTPIILCQWP